MDGVCLCARVQRDTSGCGGSRVLPNETQRHARTHVHTHTRTYTNTTPARYATTKWEYTRATKLEHKAIYLVGSEGGFACNELVPKKKRCCSRSHTRSRQRPRGANERHTHREGRGEGRRRASERGQTAQGSSRGTASANSKRGVGTRFQHGPCRFLIDCAVTLVVIQREPEDSLNS